MATLPPTLTAFRPVDGMQRDSRLGLGPEGQVQKTGEQSRLNIFSRAWDFMTRSSDQKESNKAIARDFVSGIQKAYGNEVAKMVSRELEGQLKHGRPLTAHRVERTLDKAQEMSGRIEAGNRQVMGRALDDVVKGGIQRAFGNVNDSVLSPQERREVVQRAIEQDPKFKSTTFQTPIHEMLEELGGSPDDMAPLDRAFVDHFTAVAAAALERAAQAKLTPQTMLILDRDGTKGQSVSDQLTFRASDHELGLTDDQQMHFQMAAMQMKSITDTLTSGNTPIGVMLGQISLLRSQFEEGGGEGEPRIRDMALDGKAQEFRDALLQDMRGLDQLLTGRTGLGELDEPQQRALLDAFNLTSTIRATLEEGSVRELGNAPEHLAQLRENLETLRGANPQGTEARALLQQVIEDTEKNIALLEVCVHAVEQGGMTLKDLSDIREAGLDLHQTLSLLGDTGFHGTDVAWLHAQGKPVGESLARFTPDEARALREAGIGIDIGLQYKDQGVPIHPRTLVRELTDDLVMGEPRPLSGGQVSRPYEVTYGDRQMVFKEARVGEGYGDQSRLLGIDPGDPKMAVRNVATRAVDELLGFNLVPDTRMGTLGGKLGVVMDFAKGASPQQKELRDITDDNPDMSIYLMGEINADPQGAKESYPGYKVVNDRLFKEVDSGVREMNYSQPGLRRELVKLQLLDAITAQGDRHPGNYMVELNGEGGFSRLRAIDNDQAFGPKVVNPNQLLHVGSGEGQVEVGGKLYGNTTFNGVMLPPVVDTDMKAAIDRITPESLRRELTGLLPEKEIEATLLRLHTLKGHVAQLEKDGKVIAPDQWGSPLVTKALEDPKTSYVGRDSGYIGGLPQVSYEDVST
jgi:hypothetical protein